MKPTLFEKYGGISIVSGIVQDFYRDIMEDEKLRAYFAPVKMPALMNHQLKFLGQVLGGPIQYEVGELKAAHADLGITADDYDKVSRILAMNLQDAGFEPADLEQVMSEISKFRGDIIGSP
jgi:hemoglobin